MKTQILLILLFLFISNCGFCQKNKAVILEQVELKNKEFSSILDSIFIAELKCNYYSDTLSLGIVIIVNPEDKSMFSISIESKVSKDVLPSLNPLAYFIQKKHYCIVYNYVPSEFFLQKAVHEKFVNVLDRKRNKHQLDSYEDDSFSRWQYYYQNNKFLLESNLRRCN